MSEISNSKTLDTDSKSVVIKKYTNRRLYDTSISRYITLNDIKALVLSYVDFKVVDAKSNEDLTRSTLMQIISEEENQQSPIMSTQILKEFVRFYGDSMQAMMSRFLEHSIEQFMERKASLKSPLSSMANSNSISLMQNLAQQNIDSWKNKTSKMLDTSGIDNKPNRSFKHI